jgi:hypothetical protein
MQGGDIGGIDFNIPRAAPFKISGRVINGNRSAFPDGKSAIYLVSHGASLYEANPQSLGGSLAGDVIAGDSDFEIHGVAPGVYDLFVIERATISDSYFGKTRVEVVDSDVGSLTVVLRPPTEIKARVLIDNKVLGEEPEAVASAAWNLGIRLLPMENQPVFRSPFSQPIGPERLLTIKNVREGKYRFRVSLVPSNMYVADIRREGVSVFDDGIDIGGESPGLIDILLTTGGGTVQGTVMNRGEPVPKAQVVLVPPPNRRQNPMLYKNGVTDSQGRFTFSAINPGVYKIFAWSGIPPGAPYLNSEFIARFEGRGFPVDVQNDVPLTGIAVPLIPNQ